MAAWGKRIPQSTPDLPLKAGWLPPLCVPAGLQACAFAPLTAASLCVYLSGGMILSLSSPSHYWLLLSGKGAQILLPKETALTSHHPTEQQGAPPLQGLCGPWRALVPSAGPPWGWSWLDFLAVLQGFSSAPWLVLCPFSLLTKVLPPATAWGARKWQIPVRLLTPQQRKLWFSPSRN